MNTEPDDTSLALPLAVYCLFKRLVSSNGIESPGRQPYNKSTISQILVELWLVLLQSYHIIQTSRQISDVVASICSSTPGNGLANGDEMHSNRPFRSALRSRSNVPTSCMNVSQYANVADCFLPAAVNSRCSACKVAMCSDSIAVWIVVERIPCILMRTPAGCLSQV